MIDEAKTVTFISEKVMQLHKRIHEHKMMSAMYVPQAQLGDI